MSMLIGKYSIPILKCSFFCSFLVDEIAPEILLGIRSGNFVSYDHSVDWYSLGVVACRMLTNQVRMIFFVLIDLPIQGPFRKQFVYIPNNEWDWLIARLCCGKLKPFLSCGRITKYEHTVFDDTAQIASMKIFSSVQNFIITIWQNPREPNHGSLS